MGDQRRGPWDPAGAGVFAHRDSAGRPGPLPPMFAYRGPMSNLPFGFSNSGDDDPDRTGKPEGIPGMPGGFDLSQLGSMLSQLGQMMSSATPSSCPGNSDLATQLATSQGAASHPPS